MSDQKMREALESAVKESRRLIDVGDRVTCDEIASYGDMCAGLIGDHGDALLAALAQREAQEPRWFAVRQDWDGQWVLRDTMAEAERVTPRSGRILPVYTAAPAREVPEEWREVLSELTEAHHHAVMAAHPHRHYPGAMDRFQLDMAVVNRARALLASNGGA